MESTLRFGAFCTSVLRTTDPQRAAAFYQSLIGWTAVPAATDHAFLQFNGKTVASLQRAAAGDAAWVPHVAVEDLATTTAAAIALGGSLVDTTEVPGVARTAVIRDREQALFGLWQPDPHTGAEQMEGLGSIWWIELLSNELSAARDFYGRLFGWSGRDTAFDPFGLYTVFERPGNQEGGLFKIRDEWDISPRWNTIVSVDDCDETMRRACDRGGESGFVHTVPKHGRIGSIFDPGHAELVLRGPVPAATT